MTNRQPPKRKSQQAVDGDGESPSPFARMWRALDADDDEQLKSIISNRVTEILKENDIDEYLGLFLFDDTNSISDFHADRIYAAASAQSSNKRDIILFVQSKGGRVEPAYLISKTLKRLSSSKFVVVVPRRAKSAATLIALGADEIHMGMMSQLGPIDPQFNGIPALALANALDVIAKIAQNYPKAAAMLTDYLSNQVPIRMLGYYQRISESAQQYAERLLGSKSLAEGKTAKDVASHLVHHYKDHGFVIDLDEAQSLLGSKIVKEETAEYSAADEIFQFFDLVNIMLGFRGKNAIIVGDLSNGIAINPVPERDSKSTLTNEAC